MHFRYTSNVQYVLMLLYMSIHGSDKMVGWCCVCVSLHSLCRWQVQVSVSLWISAFWHVFVYGRYHKSRLICLMLSDLDWSRHHPLLWTAAPSIQRVRMTGMPKNGNRVPISGGGKARHNLHSSLCPLWQLHRLEPYRYCVR